MPVDQRDYFKDQFIQEGALLTELSSQTASIVQARDVGTYTTPDGQWMPYMVLEWLDGMALDELLDRERIDGAAPWTLEQVIVLLAQAANAPGRGTRQRHRSPRHQTRKYLRTGRQAAPVGHAQGFGFRRRQDDE